MKYFLAKTDPETYSILDFEKDKVTLWDGVRSGAAVLVLKRMKKGDIVLIYHSQGEGSIRGVATVTKQIGADTTDPRTWLVEFKLKKVLPEPYVTLKEIKATKKFPELPLVKQSRLSTSELTPEFISWLAKQGVVL